MTSQLSGLSTKRKNKARCRERKRGPRGPLIQTVADPLQHSMPEPTDSQHETTSTCHNPLFFSQVPSQTSNGGRRAICMSYPVTVRHDMCPRLLPVGAVVVVVAYLQASTWEDGDDEASCPRFRCSRRCTADHVRRSANASPDRHAGDVPR